MSLQKFFSTTDRYEVVLTRRGSTHNRLRSDVIAGVAAILPLPGQAFFMLGEALQPGFDCRFVSTSEVQEVVVEGAGQLGFRTRNSDYGLSFKVIPQEPRQAPGTNPETEAVPS